MPDKTPFGIKDIARLAGVSIGTVDRVLHNRGRVSDESLKKIQAVILETNYKPNLIARSLVNKKKIRLALIVPDFKHDEYWKQSQKGVDAAIHTWGVYGVELGIFHFDLDDTQSFMKATTKAFSFHPAGVIFVPIFYDKGLSFLKKCEEITLPVVMFNTHLPASQPLSFIGTDSVQSGMLAAELLYLSSHTKGKFLVLHFDEDLKNSAHMLEKEKGFRDYFNREHAHEVPEIISVVLNNSSHEYQKQLITLFKNQDIRGVFVSTSKTHVIAEFLDREEIRGIKLLGYDLITKNIDLLNQGLIHFLINQNPRRQIEVAIKTMCNYLLYKTIPDISIHFPLEIITRTNLASYLQSDIH